MRKDAHCSTCTCKGSGLFYTRYDSHGGKLVGQQTIIAFSTVVRVVRNGEGLEVELAGANRTLWLYGDDRERFLCEWSQFETEDREPLRSEVSR